MATSLSPQDLANGFWSIDTSAIKEFDAALEFSRRMLTEHRSHAGAQPAAYTGIDLFVPSCYEEGAPLFDFVLSDDLLDMAVAYLGEDFVLEVPRLWWLQPAPRKDDLEATTEADPRSFHLGSPTRPQMDRCFKALIALDDITADSGPTVYLSAPCSAEVRQKIDVKPGMPIADSVLAGLVPPEEFHTFVGPTGSGLSLDTARCIHRGRLNPTRERYLLMVPMVPTQHAVESRMLRHTAAFDEKFGSDALRQRIAFGQPQ